MTETIVRDTKKDGLWHVFVDGLEIGKLFVVEADNGIDDTRYAYNYGLFVSRTYTWLSEAERDLMLMYKADAQSRPLGV